MVLEKFALAFLVKSKHSIKILKKVLKPFLLACPVNHLQTDVGAEFYNSRIKSLLMKYKLILRNYFLY